MKFTILGCGRWGTFLAWYLNKQGHEILIWGRETSNNLKQLKQFRANDYVTINDDIILSSSLSNALSFSKFIIIAIHGYELSQFMKLIQITDDSPKNYILCMKELDYLTGRPLTEIVKKYVNPLSNVAICVGPIQPKDFLQYGKQSCMIIDSEDLQLKSDLVDCFNGNDIKFFIGNDLIGNQIGAAMKNIIGIGGGILEGLNVSSLKGILMVMGTDEISNLIVAMGGKSKTAYGLCCLGDYSSTLFSKNSNSINYGIFLATGKNMTSYTPGKRSAHAVFILKEKYEVNMPICEMISSIILGEVTPQNLIDILKQRGF